MYSYCDLPFARELSEKSIERFIESFNNYAGVYLLSKHCKNGNSKHYFEVQRLQLPTEEIDFLLFKFSDRDGFQKILSKIYDKDKIYMPERSFDERLDSMVNMIKW